MRVMVCRQQRIGIADVELFLASLGLALGVFHRHARLDQQIADRAHHVSSLVVCWMCVILVVGGKIGADRESPTCGNRRKISRTGRTPARLPSSA
jgi:hypothetical protein